MDLLSLEESLDTPTGVSRVRRYKHVLRDGDNVLRRALDVEMVGRKEHGELKIT